MKIRYILAAGAIVGTTLGVAPELVHGHAATAQSSCTGLEWSAVNYDKEVTNSIVVTVDGVVVHSDADFKASDTGSVGWDETVAHAWSVVVDAPGTQHDRTRSGVEQPCPEKKVLICHRDQGHPEWKVIEIAKSALDAHLAHGDIYPVPAEGCSTVVVEDSTTTTTTTEPAGDDDVDTPAGDTVIVEVGVPPTPTTGVAIPCVQDAFGNWNWQGTTNACQGPPPTTVPVVTSITRLPRTGSSLAGAGLALLLVASGVVAMLVARRRATA